MTTMIIVIVIIITDRFGQMARRSNVLRTNGTFFRSVILGLLTRRFNGLYITTIDFADYHYVGLCSPPRVLTKRRPWPIYRTLKLTRR